MLYYFCCMLNHIKHNIMNINEIYDQLLKRNFTDEVGNSIENNTAFIRLKELSEINYQPKYSINEKVIYNGTEMYVYSITVKTNSYPNPEVLYTLSKKWNREGEENEQSTGLICESLILKKHEYDEIQINKAKKLLEGNGFSVLKL